MVNLLTKLLLLLPLLAFSAFASAQCITPTAAAPYTESFEAGKGGWVNGGNNSDWAWGKPSKQVISQAADGLNCWITGGLNYAGYGKQESWIQSPCFDFSLLTKPYLSFQVFWETENKYDGATFEYSTNNGATWSRLGSYVDHINCPNDSWFNTSTIQVINNSPGWSGNIQPTSSCSGGAGGGKGKWVTARHSLDVLAGKPNVVFRFYFGAGSVCNNYDGFAVDDIFIGEELPNDASFVFTCNSNRNLKFQAPNAKCGSVFNWNFNDPTSGAQNTSSLEAPNHNFSGPGTYQVQLTLTHPDFTTVSFSKTIYVADVNINVIHPLSCSNGADAVLGAVVNAPAVHYTIGWNTNPPSDQNIVSNLPAGDYTVTINGTDFCTAKANVQLPDPPPIQINDLKITGTACNLTNGAVEVDAAGGTGALSYSWQPAVSTANKAVNLAAGSYQITITDANGCTKTTVAKVESPNAIQVNLGNDTTICPGATLTLAPGVFNSYKWQDNSSMPTFTVSAAGTYYVTVSDAAGCTASDTLTVKVDCSDVYFPTAFTPNNDGLNDKFGPIGNVGAMQQYTLKVFNRWGQMVFFSSNPWLKWDGKVNGKLVNGTYIWIAGYVLPVVGSQERQGTVILIQ